MAFYIQEISNQENQFINDLGYNIKNTLLAASNIIKYFTQITH